MWYAALLAPASRPASLADQAADNLHYIRRTLEQSSTFTAVPGGGGAAMGAIGVVAAVVAARQPAAERWLAVWLIAAGAALVVGIVTIQRKANRTQLPMPRAVAQRFALSLAAPLIAGAALTWGLWVHGAWTLMPATWLLLYGAGLLTGGALSVAPMQLLGVSFMALGLAALATPAAWGNLWLGVGFGGLQIAFGLYIARRHGG